MDNKLYNNLLNSINREVKNIIREQFNISDIDFSDEQEHDINIFSKNVKTPFDTYNKIIKNNSASKKDVKYLNNFTSIIKPKDKGELLKIIDIYQHHKNDSLNWLDVSGITDMSFLFSGKHDGFIVISNVYNGDISQWDVSNVKDMTFMFQGSQFNQDISQWDVSNVKDMSWMFYGSKFNMDISGWDVHNVTDMSCMFQYSKFIQDLSMWDVSNVKHNKFMFVSCPMNKYNNLKPNFKLS